MEKSLLIIFVKNPILGQAKTRLAATLGKEKALMIYEKLLEKTHQETFGLACDKKVYYHAFVPENDLWSEGEYHKALQIEGSLGEKMAAAFQEAFQSGYYKVVIIGSDCYDLTSNHLQLAFDKLNEADAVLGPSQDGGYYLLGMKTFARELFENIAWSTSSVSQETLKTLKTLNKTVALLPELNDVDEAEDLGPWAEDWLNKEDHKEI